MGWVSSQSKTIASWKKEILQGYENSTASCRVVEHKSTCYGRHWWVLVETTKGDPLRFVVLYLFEKFGEGWGYKDVSEDMGPYYHDCPLSLVAKATEPQNEWSAAWRERVKNHHAALKRI